jgi:hypothetical protein
MALPISASLSSSDQQSQTSRQDQQLSAGSGVHSLITNTIASGKSNAATSPSVTDGGIPSYVWLIVAVAGIAAFILWKKH